MATAKKRVSAKRSAAAKKAWRTRRRKANAPRPLKVTYRKLQVKAREVEIKLKTRKKFDYGEKTDLKRWLAELKAKIRDYKRRIDESDSNPKQSPRRRK
jgi:hypothetical protein